MNGPLAFERSAALRTPVHVRFNPLLFIEAQLAIQQERKLPLNIFAIPILLK
jgi:hypothetical protein